MFFYILINIVFIVTFLFFINSKFVGIYKYMVIFIFAYIVIIGFIIYKYHFSNDKLENNFFAIFFSLAVLFLFVIPLMQAPDDNMHFFRTFSLVKGKMFGVKLDAYNIGNYLPVELKNTIPIYTYDSKSFVDLVDYRRLMSTYFSGDESFYSLNNTLVYFPAVYIPQTIGVMIGNLLKLNLFWIISLGRVSNALFYGLVSYLAIKVIKRKYKLILLFVSLTPMSIFLACSFSTDAAIISVSLLFTAICFKDEKYFTNSSLSRLLMYFLGFITVLGKFTFFPMLLIHWIKDRKTKISIIHGIIYDFLIISSIAIWNLFIMKSIGSITTNSQINPIEQIKYILNYPLLYLENILWTLYQRFPEYIITFNSLGCLSHTLSFVAPFTIFFIVFYSLCRYPNEPDSKKYSKIDLVIILFAALGSIVLINTALYITWTTLGSDKIQGVQGRYFIPILPLIMISIKEFFNGVNLQVNESGRKFSLASFGLLSFTVIFIFVNFWTSVRV